MVSGSNPDRAHSKPLFCLIPGFAGSIRSRILLLRLFVFSDGVPFYFGSEGMPLMKYVAIFSFVEMGDQ